MMTARMRRMKKCRIIKGKPQLFAIHDAKPKGLLLSSFIYVMLSHPYYLVVVTLFPPPLFFFQPSHQIIHIS